MKDHLSREQKTLGLVLSFGKKKDYSPISYFFSSKAPNTDIRKTTVIKEDNKYFNYLGKF